MKSPLVLSAIVMGFISPSVPAQTLYKWVDTQGRVSYQDMPPPAHSANTQTIETDSRAVYRWVDDQGVVSYQDQPREGSQALGAHVTVAAPGPADTVAPVLTSSRPSPSAARAPHDFNLLLQILKTAGNSLMGMATVLVLALLALFRVVFAAKIKGWIGERLVAHTLKRLGYPALHDIILDCDDGHPTQIDHIARTPSGLLVIETKHYKGKIYGKDHDASWTVCLRGSRHKMQNSIHQNHRHIKAVQALISGVPVFGQVIFTGSAKPPEGCSERVCTLHDFAREAVGLRDGTVDGAELDAAWKLLQKHARRDKGSRRAHLASLRARFD